MELLFGIVAYIIGMLLVWIIYPPTIKGIEVEENERICMGIFWPVVLPIAMVAFIFVGCMWLNKKIYKS